MEFLFIIVIAAALWFWWSGAQSRENAIVLARGACKRCSVQLLDETVTLSKLRLQRDKNGHMNVARWYQFEFSTSGENRRDGVVGMLGSQLLSMHLDIDMEELPN